MRRTWFQSINKDYRVFNVFPAIASFNHVMDVVSLMYIVAIIDSYGRVHHVLCSPVFTTDRLQTMSDSRLSSADSMRYLCNSTEINRLSTLKRHLFFQIHFYNSRNDAEHL